ncbi:MAG: NAD(P)-dependent glycerol-3-phosphate dehydrogenase [Chlamydiae bacterium]|nr:NAD(P)-dependent glycerol-3-phosphate dehydrogenase [Chlamydiota bacterium]
MRVGFLGSGTWGFCLASLLGSNGHKVKLWTSKPDFATKLSVDRHHPKLPHFEASDNVSFTSDLADALKDAEIIIESVSSRGIRPVFEQVHKLGIKGAPIIITSKGIEQNSGLLLPEVILEIFGESYRSKIGCLSGPSHAEEVIQKLPTSVVCSSYDPKLMNLICDAFNTSFFRVYPNLDLNGVAFGGAMKNIIAIACGISDGLGFGDNTKAALMTRGLHEIRKLSTVKGCKQETLNGLSGLGDLCVTCLSKLSRNYMFGFYLAEGLSPQEARDKVGMVVEGAYTCVSALQLGNKSHIALPITEVVYAIIYDNMNPHDAVKSLLQRAIKEEHL